ERAGRGRGDHALDRAGDRQPCLDEDRARRGHPADRRHARAPGGVAMIRTLDARALGVDAVVTALERPPSRAPSGVSAAVDEILAGVRARGDAAVLAYTAKLDGFAAASAPALVAGVKEIVLVTPPGADGSVNPVVLAAARVAGVTEGWRIGGAQAVAALAYGTATIRRVDKIVGPGNIYVALAKTRVVGEVGIDMLAGPSEVVVVADAAADPDWIAADLLAQAEHDPMARAVLITDAPALAPRVEKALAARLAMLPRREIAAAALRDHGALILTESLERAVEIANRLAPEHLELMVAVPAALLP